MARLVVKPSLRTASCCSVDVVNGAAGLRLFCFFSTRATVVLPALAISNLPTTSCCWSWLVMLNCSTFWPSNNTSLAPNACWCLRDSRWIVQYSWLLKASISSSRSTIRRKAGLCTRPADRPLRIFFQSSGDKLKPTR